MAPHENEEDLQAFYFCCYWLLLLAFRYSELRFLAATTSQPAQTSSRTNRGRATPLVANTDADGKWNDFDTALAMPPASGELLISRDIDPEREYNVPLADQHPEIQAPVRNIDEVNAARVAVELDLLLLQGEVVGLPRQIERDEANMFRRPQASLVGDVAAGAPQHLPTVIPVNEIDAIDAPDSEASSEDFVAQGSTVSLPQQIEMDEANMVRCPAEEPEIDVVHDVHDERLLALASGAGLPRVAAMNLGMSAGVPQYLSILPALPQAPVPEIDVVDAARDTAEAVLALAVLLLQGLPRQVERDEANIVRRPQVAPPSLVDEVATGAPQHLPTTLPAPDIVAVDAPAPEIVAFDAHMPDIAAVVGPGPEVDAVDALVPEINAIDALTPQIVVIDAPAPDIVAVDAPAPEIVAFDALMPDMVAVDGLVPEIDAVDAVVPVINAYDTLASQIVAVDARVDAPVPGMDEVENEADKASLERLLEQASDVARHPRVATASLGVAAGGVESNLEEQLPSDHKGNSSAEIPAEVNLQDSGRC